MASRSHQGQPVERPLSTDFCSLEVCFVTQTLTASTEAGGISAALMKNGLGSLLTPTIWGVKLSSPKSQLTGKLQGELCPGLSTTGDLDME